MNLEFDTTYIKEIPTPRQLAFFALDNLDAFYGGAAGGGKSSCLLMAALKYIHVPGYAAVLMRDSYANLSKENALMDRAQNWLGPTDARWEGDNKRWVFPSGATLSFGYLDGPRDHFNYQSAEYQFVGIDECVNIRENQARYMFSRLRKLKSLDVPIRYRCASNPPTREQLARGAWVKRKYVDESTREPGVIFVPSLMKDNPHIDQVEYLRSLDKLDPITRQQLINGDWNIQAQGEFFKREWFKIVPHGPKPDEIDLSVRFWDLAATEERASTKKQAARTSGCRMCRTHDGRWFIESIIKFRKSPREVEQTIRQTADMDGRYTPIRMEMEGGSGGKFTIDHFTRFVLAGYNFRGERPEGSKTERAAPLASQAEAGNVYLVEGQWNQDFLDEAETFPGGEYKDQIDSASGAFCFLAPASGGMPSVRLI